MNLERIVMTVLATICGALAAAPPPMLAPYAGAFAFAAGALGGKEFLASSTQKRDAKARMTLPPVAALFLLLSGCIGTETPAADTLSQLDQVCAVRAQNKELTDAVAGEADRQIRKLDEQPEAAPPSEPPAAVGEESTAPLPESK